MIQLKQHRHHLNFTTGTGKRDNRGILVMFSKKISSLILIGAIALSFTACSPEESSFTAVFTDMQITECAWKAHDGQQPD